VIQNRVAAAAFNVESSTEENHKKLVMTLDPRVRNEISSVLNSFFAFYLNDLTEVKALQAS
jgi:hypothetical protein